MLWFSHRRKIVRLYKCWLRETGAADDPMSLLAFLQTRGWLKEEDIYNELCRPDFIIICEVEE